jgi:AhpD family alkylhydroperoxidase
MTAVAAKPVKDYPWFIRLFFWKQRRAYGRVLDSGLLWGRSPWLFATVALLYGALDRRSSPVPPTLRSIVTVRVSQINHCAFCIDINSAVLAKRGVAIEKINALSAWQGNPRFDADEQLALEYAEAMTLNRVDVNLRKRLKARWSDDFIIELTGLVAFQNLSSKFNAALDVPSQGFCCLAGADTDR